MEVDWKNIETLVNKQINKVKGTCFRNNNKQFHLDACDFDDIKQEILIHLWEKISHFDKSKPIVPWANRVIHNQLINRIRNKLKHILIYSADVSNEQTLEEKSPINLNFWLKQLKFEQKRDSYVFGEYFIKGTRAVDIAEKLKLSRRHIYHIIEKYTKALKEIANKDLTV